MELQLNDKGDQVVPSTRDTIVTYRETHSCTKLKASCLLFKSF